MLPGASPVQPRKKRVQVAGFAGSTHIGVFPFARFCFGADYAAGWQALGLVLH